MKRVLLSFKVRSPCRRPFQTQKVRFVSSTGEQPGECSSIETIAKTMEDTRSATTAPRHYSTIGIGDVFLNNVSDTELVGQLKVKPEDFIVREIDPNGVIASLDLPESFEQEPAKPNQHARPEADAAEHSPPENPLEHCKQIIGDKAYDGENRFQAIEALNQQVLEKLQGVACDTHIVQLTFDDLDKEERGIVYQALRYAFPLLKACAGENTSTQINIDIDDRFYGLLPFLDHPERDLPPLYQYYAFGYMNQGALKRNFLRGETPKLRLKGSVKREDRREIHQLIDQKSNFFLGSDTVKEGDEVFISVQWTKSARRKFSNKRKRTDDNILCVVEKKQVENLSMINSLSRWIHVRTPDIGVAGIKDMMAVTTQFVTLGKVSVGQIQRARDSLGLVGVKIKPIRRVEKLLRRGQLKGNRFEIVLRDIRVVQKQDSTETFPSASENHIMDAFRRLDKGFINFFGEQRVGSPGPTAVVGVRAFDVGRAMLQENYGQAVDLLMNGRKLIQGVDKSGENMDKFRRTWKESGGDPVRTMKDLPGDKNSFLRERAILKGLKRYGDPLKALKCLQHWDRFFYLNAYQSFVFNTMASERLRCYGPNVVVGDIILREDWSPVVVKEGDLPKVRLEQVVLPIIGFDAVYPENDIGRLYKEFLANDGIRLKEDDPDEIKIKTSYRTLITKPENISCEVSQQGKATDAKICFDLQKGSYATMLFRELQRTTTAR